MDEAMDQSVNPTDIDENFDGFQLSLLEIGMIFISLLVAFLVVAILVVGALALILCNKRRKERNKEEDSFSLVKFNIKQLQTKKKT